MSISAKMCEVVCDTVHLSLEKIQSVIGSQSCIDKYLFILHDKCVKSDGTPKNPHYHIYLHFNNARQFKYVAQWFGVSESFVSKIHGRFADAVEYATHKNAPEKHQYDYSECTANFDFVSMVESNQARKQCEHDISELIQKIDAGEIKQYNIVDKISCAMYTKYRTRIESAFEFVRKRNLRKVDRNMQVFYIYGKSGLGKTTLAKMMGKKNGWECFISSSSNDPFDGYADQECIVLDDLRGSSFTFADLLKILDNNTASTVKSRYKNIILGAEAIIITSTIPPKDFYKRVFESNGEEYTQFLRRLTYCVYMTANNLDIYAYNPSVRDVEKVSTSPNPVAKIAKARYFDVKKEKEKADLLFNFADSDLQAVSPDSAPVDWSQYETLIDIDEI